MTVFDWIVLGVLIAAAVVLVYFVAKQWKKMELLDLKAMPKAKLKSKKYELIEGRMMRKGKDATTKVKGILSPVTASFKKTFDGMYKRIHELERKYRHATPEPKTQEDKEKTRQKVSTLIEQGAKLYKEENYGEAEAIFLDIVRINPKEVEAYEYLGEVYLEKKEYDHAIETLEFARGLNPNEDRIYYDLGMVHHSQGNFDKAMSYLKECVELAPNNPRNLNALLSLAIEIKDRFVAKEALRKLKESNPDNQKLGELEQVVKEL